MSHPKDGKPGQAAVFELTADELAWAKRFFLAARNMEDGYLKHALVFAEVVEQIAEMHPRRARPTLKLVGGGAS